MHQKRLALILFTPSLISGSITILLALGLNAYSAWTFIRDNELFNGLFSGAYGLHAYFGDASYGVSAWSNAFISSPAAYYILVGGVSIAAGLAVFTLLQVAGLIGRESQELLRDTPANRVNKHEALGRLGLRMVSIVGWTLYAAFFISTLLPFTTLLNELGVEVIGEGKTVGWVQCALSLVLLMCAIHLHVVLIRLIALRPRLFGGAGIVEDAETRHL